MGLEHRLHTATAATPTLHFVLWVGSVTGTPGPSALPLDLMETQITGRCRKRDGGARKKEADKKQLCTLG